jgi:hypothetical protein
MTAHRTLAVALATAAVSLVALVPRASAETQLACNYDGVSFNACLHFTYSWGWYTGHVGLDLRMPQGYAQEILACGANFRAELWGDDGGPGKDDYRRPIAIESGSPRLTPDGISATFVGASISSKQMDEDDGRDELYAKITYIDCHLPGVTRELRTTNIVGEFRG